MEVILTNSVVVWAYGKNDAYYYNLNFIALPMDTSHVPYTCYGS